MVWLIDYLKVSEPQLANSQCVQSAIRSRASPGGCKQSGVRMSVPKSICLVRTFDWHARGNTGNSDRTTKWSIHIHFGKVYHSERTISSVWFPQMILYVVANCQCQRSIGLRDHVWKHNSLAQRGRSTLSIDDCTNHKHIGFAITMIIFLSRIVGWYLGVHPKLLEMFGTDAKHAQNWSRKKTLDWSRGWFLSSPALSQCCDGRLGLTTV